MLPAIRRKHITEQKGKITEHLGSSEVSHKFTILLS